LTAGLTCEEVELLMEQKAYVENEARRTAQDEAEAAAQAAQAAEEAAAVAEAAAAEAAEAAAAAAGTPPPPCPSETPLSVSSTQSCLQM
jgi:peptidoglycan hydrolase CwlO-like protein